MDNYNNYYEPHSDFPYEEIMQKEEAEPELDYLKESMVLNELLNFIAPPRFKKNATLCRLYAILFICRPHFFNNQNITQREIADILGVSKQIFNSHVNAFRKRFGFYVSGMRHEDARAKFADICKDRADELADARRASNDAKKGKSTS